MHTDFHAHPRLGLIARAALDDYRFRRAKDVTVAADRAVIAAKRPSGVRAQQ